MWKSASNCRTNEVLPTSVLQKSTWKVDIFFFHLDTYRRENQITKPVKYSQVSTSGLSVKGELINQNLQIFSMSEERICDYVSHLISTDISKSNYDSRRRKDGSSSMMRTTNEILYINKSKTNSSPSLSSSHQSWKVQHSPVPWEHSPEVIDYSVMIQNYQRNHFKDDTLYIMKLIPRSCHQVQSPSGRDHNVWIFPEVALPLKV